MHICIHECALRAAVRIIVTMADISTPDLPVTVQTAVYSAATFGALIICERGYNLPVFQKIFLKSWLLFCSSSQMPRSVVGSYVEASP